MKINKENSFNILLGSIFIIYLFVDVVHFLMFRLEPEYFPLMSGFYENHVLSFIKWFLCLLVITSIYLDRKKIKISFFFIIISIAGILTLFILKGQWNNLIKGSLLFKLGILEIGAFLLIILAKKLYTKYRISFWKFLFFTLIVTTFWVFFIIKIPIACCG